MAGQIKELQGEMADYNTLMDKVNTDTEVDVVLTDYEMVSVPPFLFIIFGYSMISSFKVNIIAPYPCDFAAS